MLSSHTYSTITTRTWTGTDITSSTQVVTTFQQLSDKDKCVIFGVPSLPERYCNGTPSSYAPLLETKWHVFAWLCHLCGYYLGYVILKWPCVVATLAVLPQGDPVWSRPRLCDCEVTLCGCCLGYIILWWPCAVATLIVSSCSDPMWSPGYQNSRSNKLVFVIDLCWGPERHL